MNNDLRIRHGEMMQGVHKVRKVIDWPKEKRRGKTLIDGPALTFVCYELLVLLDDPTP